MDKNVPDKAKLEQVIHYIIDQVGGLAHVGKTVIYKLLYFCDLNYYEMYEVILTGEQYRKINHGPAPCHFDETIGKLMKDQKVKELQATYHGYNQIKYISLNEPDISLLSAKEIKLIDNTLERLSSMNASQLRAYSHKDIPYKATDDKEIIDYEFVFYRDPSMSFRVEEDEEILKSEMEN